MARTPRAPRLVRKDPSTGQLVLEEGTLRALRSIQGPVAVVGICGGARKGKSSLLTRIMECQGGLAQSFQASAEVDPCTKGLHISTVPVVTEDNEGRPYSLLFLDTEGIDATDQDRKDMCQVFALCVLLSSVVLLNETACIAESTLDMLSLVCDITGIVRARSAQGAQQEEDTSGTPEEDLDALAELSSFSPVLCWVLRDFSLRLKEGMGPTEYMEQALEDIPEEGRRAAAAAEKNRVRRGIRALFPARKCFTLVRPSLDEELLQEMHELQLEELRPQFAVEVKHLARSVCASATPPAVGGVPLTGALMASLCEAYIAAMNGGAVPDIGSVHLSALAAACSQAGDKALQLYVALLEEHTAHADPEIVMVKLFEFHAKSSKKALDSFAEDTSGFPGDVVGPAEGELRRRMQDKFEHVSAEVRAKAAEQVRLRMLGAAAAGAAVGGLGGCALLAAEYGTAAAAIAALPAVAVFAAVGGMGGLAVGAFKSWHKGLKKGE